MKRASGQLHHFGLMVHPLPYKDGTIYAELIPAAQPWYRRILPWVGNWWYEVHSDKDGHHIQLDGGAYTLRGAFNKAMDAVDEAQGDNF